MKLPRPISRYFALVMLLAAAGIAAVGYVALRRDAQNLRDTNRDNLLWSATQMEVELLRFELSAAMMAAQGTPEALDEMRERFDILWSRVFMTGRGRAGEALRGYDEGFGAIRAIATYLERIDPVIAGLRPDDRERARGIVEDMHRHQNELRLYTLRVMRGDTSAAGLARDRLAASFRTTALISGAAVLACLLCLFLILREHRRQRVADELERYHAAEAEQANRSKSRFLTMMSHELRNPLNGVLGPLALLAQSDLPVRLRRLVEQAQQSGQSMLQMLSGLLDYGEMQEGRFELKQEPFRISALAAKVRADLSGSTEAVFGVGVHPRTPEFLYGDEERLRQVFVHLGSYVMEACDRSAVRLDFGFEGSAIEGEFTFGTDAAARSWNVDPLMGLSELAPDQVSADTLRPMIARGLILAAKGVLTLYEDGNGRRAIRVAVPSRRVAFERIRVHLETRSAALAAIYQAALRSDRVVFVAPDSPGPVDLVLVDATTIGADTLMSQLRYRFPGALFVSLGLPQSPNFFDDVVETPNDIGTLRTSVLGRLAS
ncbi:MAG: histidine kinase dimerization/phospho-acceptor domain-containing protein [Amaricoccus sp.]|uniref:sensor histidine kinase n=1 Tax=Amaricoccus sp. TaxID=1872485 RepID=UPI003314AD3D